MKEERKIVKLERFHRQHVFLNTVFTQNWREYKYFTKKTKPLYYIQFKHRQNYRCKTQRHKVLAWQKKKKASERPQRLKVGDKRTL